jgi:hypothetical protein
MAQKKYLDYEPQMEDATRSKRSRTNETIRANNKRGAAANKRLDAGEYTKADFKQVPTGAAGTKLWKPQAKAAPKKNTRKRVSTK